MGKKLIEEFAEQVSLENRRPDLCLSRPATIADGFACDKGDLLGIITASSLLRRRSRSTVKSGGAFSTAAATGKIVDASKKFVAADVLKVLTGVLQQETATVVGTIGGSGAGNAAVVVTSNLIQGGSKTFAVPVANNDTATLVGGKIRAFLEVDGEIDEYFTVSGSTTGVVLTVKNPAAYDSTLNISIDNGTCTGLTTASTSANTTPGNAVGATLGTILSIDGDDVTLTGNAAINAAVAAVVTGSDGSEVAAFFANEGSDGDGDLSIDVIYSSPAIDVDKVYGLDSSAITELGGKVRLGELNF